RRISRGATQRRMGISGVPRRQDTQSQRQSDRLLQLSQAAGHAGLCVLLSEHEDGDSLERVSRTHCAANEIRSRDLLVSAAINLSAALTLRRAAWNPRNIARFGP